MLQVFASNKPNSLKKLGVEWSIPNKFLPCMVWLLLISPVNQTVKHVLYTIMSNILTYLRKPILKKNDCYYMKD